MTRRFVCIGYYALVDMSIVSPQNVEFDEYLEWRNIQDIPEMIFDQNEIESFALKPLCQNLDEQLLGFNLLPETFTMKELQELYESVISNFSRG